MLDIDFSDLLIWFLFLSMGLVIGVAIAEPTKLDNGCIVNGKNVYCEVAK